MHLVTQFDRVHDIQASYRKVLDAMSRPGEIGSLAEQAERAADIVPGCLPATAVLVLMLLDNEVTFKVVSAREEMVNAWLHRLTYARAVEAERADYIFVLLDARLEDFSRAIQMAATGTLENPHLSATVIREVHQISYEPLLRLTGPGIQDETLVSVDLTGDWVAHRARKNREYPMGIDFLFVDLVHRIIGLPRTTKIAGRVDE